MDELLGILGVFLFWFVILYVAQRLFLGPVYDRVEKLSRELTAVEILDRRYAAGEIDTDGYQRRRRNLNPPLQGA